MTSRKNGANDRRQDLVAAKAGTTNLGRLAAGLCALVACQPALAHDPRIEAKISRIEAQLDRRGNERDAKVEAALRTELRSIREDFGRYEADGLSDRERKELSRRLFDLGKSLGNDDEAREPPGGANF